MTFYKLRYKNGLFFKPSKGYNRTGLSVIGKVYNKKPNWKYGEHIYIDGIYMETKPEDWQIIVYETVEKEIIQC
jgi:hypothetical protein